MSDHDARFEDLKGETLVTVDGAEPGSDRVVFTTATGRRFVMFHDQDCCESVELAEVHGQVSDLVGTPVLCAEESSSENVDRPSEWSESWTWTFYRIGTVSGTVVLRWLGESNGFYSESVSFLEVTS